MTTLLLATRNAHKALEIQAILGAEFHCQTLKDFPVAPDIVEDADTFAGNATKKALGLARWLAEPPTSNHQPPTPKFVLADDSGLEVDALSGAPGVHSARFAALDSGQPGNSSTAENNAKLLRLLADVPMERRTARFHCVIAVATLHPPSSILPPQLFDGVCDGRIIHEPRGQNGFGYDPLFVPDGFAQTFAELGEEVKNRLSHRSRALAKMQAWLAVQPQAWPCSSQTTPPNFCRM